MDIYELTILINLRKEKVLRKHGMGENVTQTLGLIPISSQKGVPGAHTEDNTQTLVVLPFITKPSSQVNLANAPDNVPLPKNTLPFAGATGCPQSPGNISLIIWI